MTKQQRDALRQQRDTELSTPYAHNRRPLHVSQADLRRRKSRRRAQARVREWVAERQ